MPIALQIKIQDYLEYSWHAKHNQQVNEQTLKIKLNTALRNELTIQLNARIISQSTLLVENFSESLLFQTSLLF